MSAASFFSVIFVVQLVFNQTIFAQQNKCSTNFAKLKPNAFYSIYAKENRTPISKEDLKSIITHIAYYMGIVKKNLKDSNYTVETKKDSSPVSSIDLFVDRAWKKLVAPLKIPVISEEGYKYRKDLNRNELFWIIDPINGTANMLAGHDSYSIDIALMRRLPSGNVEPILGIIALPDISKVYFAAKGVGSYVYDVRIEVFSKTPKIQSPKKHLTASISYVSDMKKTETLLRKLYPGVETISYIKNGASFRFIDLIEGRAHVNTSISPEFWDYAPGHALLAIASGKELILPNFLDYKFHAKKERQESRLSAIGVASDF